VCRDLKSGSTSFTGESNSVLIVGPRGCGKTLLVNTALHNVSESYQNTDYHAVSNYFRSNTAVSEVNSPDSKTRRDIGCDLLQVKLSGLLQTDDNIALEEITRQLKLENVIDGLVFGSFAEKLQFLLESLRGGSKNTKPVVFIIDEFDLFTNHKNQTLLYNLFDISQSNQTPVCVIGVTCRLDVIELLEKRVKSRFSHRMVHMFREMSYGDMIEIFRSYITLPTTTKRLGYNHQWNDRIDSLLKVPMIKDGLMFRFNMVKDLHLVKSLIAMIVGRWSLGTADGLPDEGGLTDTLRSLEVDGQASVLQGVSVLELCLIISMRQLTEIYSGEPFNFQMVYEHYRKFSEKKSSMKMFNKPIVLKAFEHLIDLEFVKPADHSLANMKEYRPMRLMLQEREIIDAVSHYSGCPSDIKLWATSEAMTQ